MHDIAYVILYVLQLKSDKGSFMLGCASSEKDVFDCSAKLINNLWTSGTKLCCACFRKTEVGTLLGPA